MLDILKTVTMSPAQYEMVIEGMRNSYDSWGKSDSHKTTVLDENTLAEADFEFFIGKNDLTLMSNLASSGGPHSKYRRMMPVWVTINAPLYWWKEFDTYRAGVAPNPLDIEENSCSTMHRITAKEFEVSDFSSEHLFDGDTVCPDNDIFSLGALKAVIHSLNKARDNYLKTKDKRYWYAIIQTLPSSYNQRRTIMLNYEALAAIYRYRKDHELDEWHTLCDWIKSLPYSELIIGKED